MEGEYPFAFASGDAGVAVYGLVCAVAAVFVVAEETAQEAYVVGGNVVVVVEGYGGEGADEDAELLLVGDLTGEYGIEGVVAFDDDDVVGAYAEAVVFVDALSELEVVAGEEDFLTVEELGEVAIEEVGVDGLYALEVVVAAGIFGGVGAVDEVVVGGDGVGAQTAGYHEYGEAFGCGGLAAR